MAGNDIFTFYPEFSEFLPVYRNISRVWLGDGVHTGTAGVIYAELESGSVVEIGPVTMYQTAVQNGYTGTEAQWVQMITNVANAAGSSVVIKYALSTSGTTHPTSGWGDSPVYEKGKFTWVRATITWVNGPSDMYFVSYCGTDGAPGEQGPPGEPGRDGVDGQVQSVNGEIGDVALYGENMQMTEDDEATIKEYVDSWIGLESATDEEIDALFGAATFSGAVFLYGRRFEAGDTVVIDIEAITENAPMPSSTTLTLHPSGGSSCHFSFPTISYDGLDVPAGVTTQVYEYKIKERSISMDSVTADDTEYTVAVTLTDVGDGTIKVDRSTNYNLVYFTHTYSALGRITLAGTVTLNGRSMAAREFMFRVKEGNHVVLDNVSTALPAATGEAVAIVFPPINYTLNDIGTHTYTVQQIGTNGNGITLDDRTYTVTVDVLDEIRDGALEIQASANASSLDFVNTYAASGSVTFTGTKSLVHRLFRATDSYAVVITGNGKLPSPARANVALTVGESSQNFSFETVTYTLTDMRNLISGYDDQKVFTYTVTEDANIPGVTGDGRTHTITVVVTDNKLGQLIPVVTYSDGEKIMFDGIYDASASITITGTKTLTNRKFVATDYMSVSIRSTNSGKLPSPSTINVTLTAGQNSVNFNFAQLTFNLSDINYLASKTYSYIIEEATVITGATNDANVHSLELAISDNYDGTLSIVPTYSDGNKVLFESIYNAAGYLAIVGTKTLQNRNFRNEDTMSVTITAIDGGRLPNPSVVNVPLSNNTNVANFNFAQIAYDISDLGGLNSKVFNYTATETCNMTGTTANSTTDPIVVTVTDNTDGTLSVVPTYTSNNKVTFTNVYASSGNLNFRVRTTMTNGNLSSQPITVKITQVAANNSTTQASNNVVLANPSTMTANTGSSQDLVFTNIVNFVKNSVRDDTANSYWFLIEEVTPTLDANNVSGNIYYDTTKKWVNVSVTDNGNGTLNVTKIPAADSSTNLDITFRNEQLGTLTITNTWAGDHSSLTTVQKEAITFNISGPNSYTNSFTYGSMVNNSKSFDSLELGEYVVSVSNNTIENFTITPSFMVGQNTTDHITLTDGAAKTMAVTNNVNKLEGSLTVTMAFTGDHEELTSSQKESIQFTVTGPKQVSTDVSTYSQSFTYEDMVSNSMTFSHLTLGTYTVTASDYQFTGYTGTASYAVDNVATNEIAIADGDNGIVAVSIGYVADAPVTPATTLVGRTFTFNNGFSGGETAIEVNAAFTDGNDDTYVGLKYNPPENDHVLQYYPQEGFMWTDAYHWDDIGTNMWVDDNMKTITFTADPTTFTGVDDIDEFETWLLSVATEQQ